MRTTLTLDDDVARALKERARTTGISFKEVVNAAIRRGLQAGEASGGALEPFVVRPKHCGFRVGVDLRRLNQVVDQLEVADFLDRMARSAPAPAEETGPSPGSPSDRVHDPRKPRP